MYNVFNVSINKVKNSIPEMILVDTFLKNQYNYRDLPVSLDERIKEEVIYKRVFIDLNLRSNNTVNIPLRNAQIKNVPLENNNTMYGYNYVVILDKADIGGRSIISPITLKYYNYYMNNGYTNTWDGYNGVHGGGLVNGLTNSLSGATDDASPLSSARLSLLSENTILINNCSLIPNLNSCQIECIVSNDESLSDIKPKVMPYISDLVVLATKAYIYNKMVLALDQGRLIGGHELGRYREIIDSYADANQMYDEMLENKINKILFMNNDKLMENYVKATFGGRR
jgi:hypothetical protein